MIKENEMYQFFTDHYAETESLICDYLNSDGFSFNDKRPKVKKEMLQLLCRFCNSILEDSELARQFRQRYIMYMLFEK